MRVRGTQTTAQWALLWSEALKPCVSLRYTVFPLHAVGDTSWLRDLWTKVASAMLTLNWVPGSEFLLRGGPIYNHGRDGIRLVWLIWCRQDMVKVAKSFQLQNETIMVFNLGGGGWEACLEVGGRRTFFGSLPARFIIRLIETIKANSDLH